MIKIGITGSIASGKSTASKILSRKRGPLFNADQVVNKLYRNVNFKKLLITKFNISKKSNFKSTIKRKILQKKSNIKKLEKIVHPIVRKEMNEFTNNNKNKKILFYEIPLLIESKLMKFFDLVIFIKAKKEIRKKRFKARGGEERLFNILNTKQLSDKKKIKFCDYVVVNEHNLDILKSNLIDIIKKYV
tara:strand:- start:165 stop:731 length:567 start_codon:yes stop_codon:yes gene_type:complete